MTVENFERYTRANLQGHKSVVDAESIWAAVQLELHPPKRKRRFLWFWLSIGILLGSAGLYFAATQFQNNPKPSIATAIPVSSEIQNDLNSDKNGVIEKNENNDQTLTRNNEITFQQDKINIPPKNTPTNLTNKVIANPQPIIAVKPVSTSPINAQNNLVNIIEQKSDIISDEPIVENEVIEEKRTTTPINIDSEIKKSESIDLESIPSKEIVSEEILPTEDVPEEAVNPVIPPRRSFTKDLSIGFGLRSGITNYLTTLREFDEANSPLRNIRETSESSLETIELGLEVLIKHDLGFYASTGAEFQRYTRKMNFDEEIVTVDSIQGTTKIFINPITLDTTKEMGLIAQTTTTTQVKEIFNVHEFINIPLSLGYGFNYDAWTFGVEGSAIFNIRTNYKGQIMDSENSFYSLTDDPNNWFKENVGISFRGSILVGYTIGDAVQVYFGPSFRSPIRLDDKDNPIAQEQTGLGLQLGARYWLQ